MPADFHYRGLFAYTWDLAEIEPDQMVAQMQRLSLNTLTIAASYHAGKFLRPHGKSGKVYFPQDGYAHCRVRPERYGLIKPEISEQALEHDVLGIYAGRHDISVNAWTVLLHNSRLGAKHPSATTRNVFGDRYCYSLCPSCPDVREYAVQLCTDIADGYPVNGLTLETPGWLPYRHGYHHEFALVGQSPLVEFYLGLCFCENCNVLATRDGIDMDGLAERVRSRITASLSAAFDPTPSIERAWIEADLLHDPDLAAFLRWRNGVVTRLVAEIRASVRKDATVHVIPSVNQPQALSFIEGSDLAALNRVSDGLEICLYSSTAQAALTDLAAVRSRAGIHPIRCVLRPAPPDYAEEPGFQATMQTLALAGVTDFGFYNFGHVRQSALEWIGRAFQAIDRTGSGT